MTQPLVLTRIRQDVSAGKCVAKVVSPLRQHTSCSSKVISDSVSIANLLHRARMPWITELPRRSWLWDVPKNPHSCGTAQPRAAWTLADFCVCGSPCRKRTLFLVGNVDCRDLHRIARKCAGTGGRCSVSGQKNMFIQKFPHHAQSFPLHATVPAYVSHFAMIPTMNTSFEWNVIFTKRVKGYWCGSY